VIEIDEAARAAHLAPSMPLHEAARVVHIVDDSPAVCQAVALLLLGEGLSVAIHGPGSPLLEAFPSLPPDSVGCIITDVRMPGLDGLTLLKRVHEWDTHLPVIVMTAHGDVIMAVQAMKAGAMDFLEKPFDDEKLLDVVRNALQRPFEKAHTQDDDASADRIAALSARERQVFDLLVTGKPNKVAARVLGISPRTVEAHRARILERLRVRTLGGAVRLTMLPKPVGEPHSISPA